MKNNLMTHVVAGYPSKEECIKLLLGMQKAGVQIIEVQIPFSDPIADGETIMKANDAALEGGTDLKASFKLVKEARRRGLIAELYFMSYLQKAVHLGFDTFCREAASAGAKGLIIPDLPYDSPDYGVLVKSAEKYSLQLVPVVSPGIPKERLKGELAHAGDLVYLTSRKGITGNKLAVSSEVAALSREVRKLSPKSAVAIGFGIQSAADVRQVLKIADLAVVGSAVIREVEKSGTAGALRLIESLGKN